jgi:hypothetical protein
MAEDEGRWLSPLFFLSYPRASRRRLPQPPDDPDRHVKRFFVDLCRNVDALVSPPVGIDLGFMDKSMNAGEEWEPQLNDALDTCRCFVALLSPSFGRSQYCMQEWDRFARRRVVRQADSGGSPHETAIVAVTWVPIRTKELPQRLRTVQRFSPEGLPRSEMAALYQDYGIFGLLQTKQEETYLNVVWMLARRVAEICNGHRVEPAERNEVAP